jgi:TRAP-type mannitol/chloroaromatic compound transport system substrate-binding protein
MHTIEIIPDAYPEQIMAATRDEIRRLEREQAARDAARRRRQERRAALRARVAEWFGR